MINLLCPRWYPLTLNKPLPDNGVGKRAVWLDNAQDYLWRVHQYIARESGEWDFYRWFYWEGHP